MRMQFMYLRSAQLLPPYHTSAQMLTHMRKHSIDASHVIDLTNSSNGARAVSMYQRGLDMDAGPINAGPGAGGAHLSILQPWFRRWLPLLDLPVGLCVRNVDSALLAPCHLREAVMPSTPGVTRSRWDCSSCVAPPCAHGSMVLITVPHAVPSERVVNAIHGQLPLCVLCLA